MSNDLPDLPTLRLGHYRHYKGGEYEVIGVARHSETLEPLVLYRPLYNSTGLWVRPFAMFVESVQYQGWSQPRFGLVEPADVNTSAGATAVPTFPTEGGCDCRAVRYRMLTRPLFVHCCHCRWCQRESGAAFALNAMIEADRIELLGQVPECIDTPSASGRGQSIARCPVCKVAVWSNYSGAGPRVHFVRVGTLDNPDLLPPDIHIFTASRQPWVVLPPGTPAVPEYYDREQYWPADSLARRATLLSTAAGDST